MNVIANLSIHREVARDVGLAFRIARVGEDVLRVGGIGLASGDDVVAVFDHEVGRSSAPEPGRQLYGGGIALVHRVVGKNVAEVDLERLPRTDVHRRGAGGSGHVGIRDDIRKLDARRPQGRDLGDIRDHGIGSVRLTGGFASRLVFVCKLPIFVDRRFKTGIFLIVRIVFLGKVQALRRLCRRHVVAILREGLQSPRRHADAERQHRSHEIA